VRLKDPDKRPCRFRLREQRGSMLVEVMVGAVVLAIATTALLNGIDGAQSAATKNKARSTAAALAEQDQERMRALPVSTLAGYSNTRTVGVKGVNYTVTSSTQWVTDQGGPISCSNNTKTAANIRITSAVTGNAYTGVVDEVSLVTPPPGIFAAGEGRAIVKINDASGAAKVGVGVSLTGPGSYSATTNSLGCAVFPFVTQGAYTASVSGLVDWQGNNPATRPIGVTAGTSTTASMELDSAAQINAVFDTQVNGATAVAAKSPSLTLTNAKLTVGAKTFPTTPGAPVANINAPNLFPFTDGYGAYAGKCSQNSPAASPNTGTLPVYTPTAGQTLTMTTANDIRVPSINIRVVSTTAGATYTTGASVYIYPADVGCTNRWTTPQTSNASGAMPEPGFPYGKYTLCATAGGKRGFADQYPYTNTTTVNETISNNKAAGNSATYAATTDPIRIYLGTTGTCPAP
jgi:Tfp pilus assembly protein PilV